MDPIPLNLRQQAINAALDGRWEDALTLNDEILKEEPKNVDALNRLARAYLELGKISLAKKYYSATLEFDAYNPIALKNLKLINATRGEDQVNGHTNGSIKISPTLFLQEPGKTKVVNLLKVAEPQKLSLAFCGMGVELVQKNRGITVLDCHGQYLGVLPDDTAHQLLRLIKGGNKYEAFVKSVKVNGVAILIRETYRSAKFRNQPSFIEFNKSSLPSTDIISSLGEKDDADDEEVPEEEES